MADLTGANCIYMLAVTGLYPVPQQLQGFAVDDVFSTDDITASETLMGVDGRLSGGFINVEVPQAITLQADSPSVPLFDQWYLNQKYNKKVFIANGIVILPGLGSKWTMTKGFLKGYPPIPKVGKLAGPRKFGITWESVDPVNI